MSYICGWCYKESFDPMSHSCREEKVKEMGGCHNTELEGNPDTQHCSGCGVTVRDCKCVWSRLREIYQMVSDLLIKVNKIESGSINIGLFDSHNKKNDVWKEGCEHFVNRLMKRMDEVENKFKIILLDQSNLKSFLNNLAENFYEKKPHECPICKGFGSTHVTSNEFQEGVRQHYLTNNRCHSCEGKGVLWG
jgi:hypothetical protein